MADQRGGVVPQCPYQARGVTGQGPAVVSAWRFVTAAVAAQIDHHERELPRQRRCDPVPDRMRLGMAVQQQQGCALPADAALASAIASAEGASTATAGEDPVAALVSVERAAATLDTALAASRDAAEREAALFRRCPELRESADIRFLDPGPVEDARQLPLEALRQAHADAPFTTAHVSIDSDTRSLSLARAFHALAARERWNMGPVFTRLSNSRDLARLPVRHEPAELVGFGANADFAESIGLFDPNSDYLARLFHQAYRRSAKPDAPANRPWEDLTEEFRESNRRLLVHLPAKLLTAGIDLAAWLRIPLPRPNDMGGIPLPDLATHPALMEQLAELEHRRWMVDRRLSGWRYGPVRDNEEKLHPDLIPYDQLDAYTQELDRAIVREAWDTLGSTRGSGFFAQADTVKGGPIRQIR